ncbi:TIR domain-containing protein [Vibrio splendidus]|uniref:TIR domain-containing protein n=1 Tax=Vibrio splendidus TaxID=29497 RepID=UPI0034A0BBE2
MKVFISWSGDESHKVALALREWLPSVVQSIDPYVSSEDIDKGTRWASDIAGELDESAFGILCVTKQNLDAPWLNFEAGLLEKVLIRVRSAPFFLELSVQRFRVLSYNFNPRLLKEKMYLSF